MSRAADRSGASPDPERSGSGGGEDRARPPAPEQAAPAPAAPAPAADPDPEGDALKESEAPERTAEPGTPAAAEAVAADASAYQDRWLRAEAELQNFRRRSAKELEEARRHAEEAVMLDLIGLLDDLERGIDAARAAGAAESWLQGIELVAARMRDSLARRGVKPIDPMGQPFDPGQHEALLEVPAPEGMRPGDVAQVILKGYRRGGRPLRPARVVVARVPGESDD